MTVNRKLEDFSHEFLVECVQLLEDYTASMFAMILQHHPYMGPAATEMAKAFSQRMEELDSRYPVSAIVVPASSIITSH